MSKTAMKINGVEITMDSKKVVEFLATIGAVGHNKPVTFLTSKYLIFSSKLLQ